MPSGLSNRKDNSDAILGQILEGVKKFPGNVAGAPIDLANILANALRASVGVTMGAAGAKADSLPQLDDNPVGGSKWINEKFGLKSTGTADEITQAVTGLISPSSGITTAAKVPALLKAMILPAVALKGESAARYATKMLDVGVNPKTVYRNSGIYQGLESDAPLKAVLPDTNARLQSVGGVLRDIRLNPNTDQKFTQLPSDFQGKLPDVLDHPELFRAMPELADVNIKAQPYATGAGSFTRSDNTIRVGPGTSDEQFLSVLLHETQHAVQAKAGFAPGGNPGMFIRDVNTFNKAREAARADSSVLVNKLDDANDQAYQNYLNILGEGEARLVQYMRKSPNILENEMTPAQMQVKEAGGIDKLIDSRLPVEKLDDDPTIQAILKFYTSSN